VRTARLNEIEGEMSQSFKAGDWVEAKRQTIQFRYWRNMQQAIEDKLFGMR